MALILDLKCFPFLISVILYPQKSLNVVSSLGLPNIIFPNRDAPAQNCLKVPRLEVCAGKGKKHWAEDELQFEKGPGIPSGCKLVMGCFLGSGIPVSKTGGPILSPNQMLGVLYVLNCSTPNCILENVASNLHSATHGS